MKRTPVVRRGWEAAQEATQLEYDIVWKTFSPRKKDTGARTAACLKPMDLDEGRKDVVERRPEGYQAGSARVRLM